MVRTKNNKFAYCDIQTEPDDASKFDINNQSHVTKFVFLKKN